ncbi:MAG TPA: phage tail protein [Persephonella sp.]|nr:phage tail protein [Persephonella sp.]
MYERNDPLTSFRFRVRFLGENKDVAGFSSITGLEVKVETETYQEGGSDQVISLPKGVSYTNAVFKRGVSGKELYDWYKKTVSSIYNKENLPYRDIVILIYDTVPSEDAQPKWQIILESSIPVKWSLSELNAGSNAVLIETLEIAFRGLRRHE